MLLLVVKCAILYLHLWAVLWTCASDSWASVGTMLIDTCALLQQKLSQLMLVSARYDCASDVFFLQALHDGVVVNHIFTAPHLTLQAIKVCFLSMQLKEFLEWGTFQMYVNAFTHSMVKIKTRMKRCDCECLLNPRGKNECMCLKWRVHQKQRLAFLGGDGRSSINSILIVITARSGLLCVQKILKFLSPAQIRTSEIEHKHCIEGFQFHQEVVFMRRDSINVHTIVYFDKNGDFGGASRQ